MTVGFTFDTGMLIALERRRRRAEELLLRAREQRIVPVVPAGSAIVTVAPGATRPLRRLKTGAPTAG